jgi:integrase
MSSPTPSAARWAAVCRFGVYLDGAKEPIPQPKENKKENGVTTLDELKRLLDRQQAAREGGEEKEGCAQPEVIPASSGLSRCVLQMTLHSGQSLEQSPIPLPIRIRRPRDLVNELQRLGGYRRKKRRIVVIAIQAGGVIERRFQSKHPPLRPYLLVSADRCRVRQHVHHGGDVH